MGDKRTADYFHENHIPKKCVFIENEYAEIVCRKLNIEYRTCFRGFNRGCPIYSGVFIYKTDLLIFSNFLREYSENINTVLKNEIGIKSADTWRKIFKTVTKYLEIRQMLGLEDVQR
ncbi:hypothetical protein NBO_27g0037 [Nosema bombycis CQ1]|uniref:Rad4 beta-hairpin domain-containing protein n=1 Tax=Nosema bombycis (strain CQ1 / CVCC 102059) TaxID=578461 RepID=R0MJT1_NOSB1|nr:hypothetical protein NBO_27g0037 [Nosema bombycis CQ1]|eukprot:EOB14480.1 hypothetical protein NBO_27g0037 [Nosema bombycis CQ1]